MDIATLLSPFIFRNARLSLTYNLVRRTSDFSDFCVRSSFAKPDLAVYPQKQ